MLFPFRAWSDCLCENHPIHHILPCPWVVASRALGFTGERMGQQRAIGALCAEILRLALQASVQRSSHSTGLQVSHTLWPSALAQLQNLQRPSEAIKLSCQVTIARAWLTCASSLGSPNSIESRGAHLFTAHLLGWDSSGYPLRWKCH